MRLYTYVFDRRSMSFLVSGLLLVGLLLFGAGFILGVRSHPPGAPADESVLEPLGNYEGPLSLSAPPLPPVVLAPSPAPVTAAAGTETPAEPIPRSQIPVAPARGTYFVQVGVFGVPANAARQVALLEAEGFDVYVDRVVLDSGGIVETVGFGAYSTPEAARRDADRYLEISGREAIVRFRS